MNLTVQMTGKDIVPDSDNSWILVIGRDVATQQVHQLYDYEDRPT